MAESVNLRVFSPFFTKVIFVDDFTGTQKIDVVLSFLTIYRADDASSKVFIQRSVERGQADTSIVLSPTLKLTVMTFALVDKLLCQRNQYTLL